MRGAVIHGPRDVRLEERDDPRVIEPTDAIIRLPATCICGSDLWPYRGIGPIQGPAPIGHKYVGIVEEVGRDVRTTSVTAARARIDGAITPSGYLQLDGSESKGGGTGQVLIGR